MLVRLAMDAQTMTSLSHLDVMPLALGAGTWFAAGVLIGACYFLTLRWNVWMFTTRRSLLLPFGIQLARFALMAVTLTVIASWFGALALIAATAGILVTRTAIIRSGAPS
jgi:N-ATPase, AtpR subunit